MYQKHRAAPLGQCGVFANASSAGYCHRAKAKASPAGYCQQSWPGPWHWQKGTAAQAGQQCLFDD